MRLNIECKEPEIILNILRNLFVNEEVTLTKKYSSTADFEINSEWDCCEFAVIHLSEEWKKLQATRFEAS